MVLKKKALGPDRKFLFAVFGIFVLPSSLITLSSETWQWAQEWQNMLVQPTLPTASAARGRMFILFNIIVRKATKKSPLGNSWHWACCRHQGQVKRRILIIIFPLLLNLRFGGLGQWAPRPFHKKISKLQFLVSQNLIYPACALKAIGLLLAQCTIG